MQKRLILAVALALPLLSYAVPAWRGPLQVSAADGSEMTVYQQGDEHFHYFTNAEGQWFERDNNNQFIPCEALSDEQVEARRALSPKLQTPQRSVGKLNLAPSGLIILVSFPDLDFLERDSLAAMDEMHNGEKYNYRGATGSARKYFQDQSMGAYNPHFNVVGPVKVSKSYTYYGSNDREGSDLHPALMVAEACDSVKKNYPEIDFTEYDHDKDGFVDFVFVIYAGHNEAMGAPANTIWPHNYYVYSGKEHIECIIDGVQIDNYACASELRNASGTSRAGIGTFCHEFSHVLGLPDLYTTNNAKHKTMGAWDIMDQGPYNNNSNTPPSYSAYERFFMGWLTPTVISERDDIELQDIQQNEALLLCESGTHNLNGVSPNPTEFYMLENRQKRGWNSYIPGEGLMITHITYNSSIWRNNTVNNDEKNMGVDIVEADGKKPDYDDYIGGNRGYEGKQGDLFPTDTKNSFKPYDKYPLTKIQMEDGIVKFKFMGGLRDLNQYVLDDEGIEVIEGIYTIDGINTGLKDLNLLTDPGQYIVYKSKNGKPIPSAKIVITDK